MKDTPALVTQTKLNHDGSVDARVAQKLKVTYIFEITSSKKILSLPYAVAVSGVVSSRFKDSPQKLNCKGGKIEVYVSAGERVELFLNSDAHPSYRKNPVYSITPSSCDVQITVVERLEKNSETDEPRQNGEALIDNKNTKLYEATLNGDIWMRISHKYTPAEVDSLIASRFSPLVVENVKKIYENLKQTSLSISVPPKDTKSSQQQCIVIRFEDSDNARDNIKNGYEFLSEGLPRSHPAGYAAVINAALTTGISKVNVSCAWRPMLGSIAHRAGLGLDVNFIGSTRLNRQELRGIPKDTKNVSEEEKTLFSSFEQAKKKQSAVHKEVSELRAELQKSSKGTVSVIEAKRRLEDAAKAADEADARRKSAEAAWILERDKNEPDEVKRFRQALITSPSISQLFDPWVMDANTRDDKPAESNTQTDPNETLHAHHLHITVREPKIL